MTPPPARKPGDKWKPNPELVRMLLTIVGAAIVIGSLYFGWNMMGQ